MYICVCVLMCVYYSNCFTIMSNICDSTDTSMSFCIVEGKVKRVKDTPKYIEVEHIISLSISNFKGAIGNSDILSKFDLDPQADPNINYNLLSSTINEAKSLHIPKKIP